MGPWQDGRHALRNLTGVNIVLDEPALREKGITSDTPMSIHVQGIPLKSALEVNCALLIDKLAGLRNQEAFSDFSEKAPDAPEFFGNQYVDLNGATWQEINLQLLAQQAHFLTIGA